MIKLFRFSIILSVFAIAIAFNSTPAQAQDVETFDLIVKHNINGRSLGADKALTVDVFANFGYAFTFSFGETRELTLPAGPYFIEVKLGGATIIELDAGEIPAGVTVNIKAQLSANKTPALKVNVK